MNMFAHSTGPRILYTCTRDARTHRHRFKAFMKASVKNIADKSVFLGKLMENRIVQPNHHFLIVRAHYLWFGAHVAKILVDHVFQI